MLFFLGIMVMVDDRGSMIRTSNDEIFGVIRFKFKVSSTLLLFQINNYSNKKGKMSLIFDILSLNTIKIEIVRFFRFIVSK